MTSIEFPNSLWHLSNVEGHLEAEVDGTSRRREDDEFLRRCGCPGHMPWQDEAWFERHGVAQTQPFNAADFFLSRWAQGQTSRRTAVIADGVVWTYGDLDKRVRALSALLIQQFGICRGERVLLVMRNTPWHLALILAVWRAGAIAVLHSPSLVPEDLQRIIGGMTPKAAIVDGALPDLDGNLSLAPMIVESGSLVAAVMGTLLDTPDTPSAQTASTDPAVILFTSGATGTAKAVIHHHRDLIVSGYSYGMPSLGISYDDVIVGTAPLSFAYGLEMLLQIPLQAGAAVCLLDDSSAPLVLSQIEKFRATVLCSTPAVIRQVVELIPRFDVGSLRVCLSAGENLTTNLESKWSQASGVPLINGYGLTEINAFVLGGTLDQRVPGSSGQVVTGFQVKIVDDRGIEVPAGTVGRLIIRGPSGCRYVGAADLQAMYVIDGWTYTNDLFVRDQNGQYWSYGRTDDLIIRGGVNVAPLEIEQVFQSIPYVKECAVIGSFSPDHQTNFVIAFVALKNNGLIEGPDAAQLRRQLSRKIARHKVPDVIRIVDTLPRNPNGKINRKALRDEYGASRNVVSRRQ